MSQWMNDQERADIERELYDSCVDEAGAMFVAALAVIAAILGALAFVWHLNS